MTESDWLTGEDPRAMLEHLRRTRRIHRTVAGQRKLRLFLCACFRQLWDYLPDPRSRAVIELAERLADGAVDPETIDSVAEAADAALSQHLVRGRIDNRFQTDYSIPSFAALIHFALEADSWQGVGSIAGPIDHLTLSNNAIGTLAGPTVRACLIRELFGNPFTPTIPDVVWLDWHDGTVWKMARTIYNECRFEDLPILADALEDAGCIESDFLDHCRGGGIHTRGCWAVDLLLGKG